MADALYVFFRDALVGTLWPSESGPLNFEYADSWQSADEAFPISLSLPLHAPAVSPSAAHHFFGNLLPEENVRRRVCAKLKISAGNDFELLRAIGGECAGALRLLPEPIPPRAQHDYEPIATRRLAEWSRGTPDAFSSTVQMGLIRLSLAGAQDKLPVRVRNGTFWIPRGDAPSSHLLKFGSRDYSHLPANEHFTTELARAVGLNVVETTLHPTAHEALLVVRRYDRIVAEDGVVRLHQEDFCQALGISSQRKYEQEGGPSLRSCAALIRAHFSMPAVDLRRLIEWASWNWLVGNADGHGKNLAVLYSGQGRIELAPFYDLVCTRNYPQLDRRLAMGFGGAYDPGQIGHEHVAGLAAEFGVNRGYVQDLVVELLDRIETQLRPVAAWFREMYGESPVLQRLPRIIRRQLRRARELL